MANRTRNIQLKICLNEEEKQIFEKKMKLTKCKAMSHFICKSILEGDIFVVDLQPFVDLQGLLYNATNNINQIAKRVNTTALIYKDDIQTMKEKKTPSQKKSGKYTLFYSQEHIRQERSKMAVTKIHPIKSTLNLAIDYITNNEKTDQEILISTHKCHVTTAHTQFLKRREQEQVHGTVLARHLIQSILPG